MRSLSVLLRENVTLSQADVRVEECNRTAASLMRCHAGVGFAPFLHMSANKATSGKTLGSRLSCMCRSSEKMCRVVGVLTIQSRFAHLRCVKNGNLNSAQQSGGSKPSPVARSPACNPAACRLRPFRCFA